MIGHSELSSMLIKQAFHKPDISTDEQDAAKRFWSYHVTGL